MPYKLKTPCLHPGCREINYAGYCKKHKREKAAEVDRDRPSSNSRGYNYKWQKSRVPFLKAHPLCVYCKTKGIITAARVVDHIVPHKGDMNRFWDKTNWQALCISCHNRKSVTEPGGAFAKGRGCP